MNLIPYAEAILQDAKDPFGDLSDEVFAAAEQATIYHHECRDIIDRYEDECDDDVPSSKTYTASEWREALEHYAFHIARHIIGAEVERLVEEIKTARDLLADVLPDELVSNEPTVTDTCPYGWAPHEREDHNNILYWLPDELEGNHAVAIKAGPVWLSHSWSTTPA